MSQCANNECLDAELHLIGSAVKEEKTRQQPERPPTPTPLSQQNTSTAAAAAYNNNKSVESDFWKIPDTLREVDEKLEYYQKNIAPMYYSQPSYEDWDTYLEYDNYRHELYKKQKQLEAEGEVRLTQEEKDLLELV